MPELTCRSLMATLVVIPQMTWLSYPPTGVQIFLLLPSLFWHCFASAMPWRWWVFLVTKFAEFIEGCIIDPVNFYYINKTGQSWTEVHRVTEATEGWHAVQLCTAFYNLWPALSPSVEVCCTELPKMETWIIIIILYYYCCWAIVFNWTTRIGQRAMY